MVPCFREFEDTYLEEVEEEDEEDKTKNKKLTQQTKPSCSPKNL